MRVGKTQQFHMVMTAYALILDNERLRDYPSSYALRDLLEAMGVSPSNENIFNIDPGDIVQWSR
jgi:hypothetical protein